MRIRLLAIAFGMEEPLSIEDLHRLHRQGELEKVVLSFSVLGTEESGDRRPVIFGKSPGRKQMSH